MSGAPLLLAGTACVVVGIPMLGAGFYLVRPSMIFAGAAMVVAGLVLHAIGKAVPL